MVELVNWLVNSQTHEVEQVYVFKRKQNYERQKGRKRREGIRPVDGLVYDMYDILLVFDQLRRRKGKAINSCSYSHSHFYRYFCIFTVWDVLACYYKYDQE
jgi:hypothetical protein